MSLSRTDVKDGTVAVIVVVPLHKRACPLAGMLEIHEAVRPELWPILCSVEQRFYEGVVVVDARAGVGSPQSEPAHRHQGRGGLTRRAVIAVQYRLVVQHVQAHGASRATQRVYCVFGVAALAHFEADALAAILVQNQVQIELPADHRGPQVRHVPAKEPVVRRYSLRLTRIGGASFRKLRKQ
jgi:hypothetical protein